MSVPNLHPLDLSSEPDKADLQSVLDQCETVERERARDGESASASWKGAACPKHLWKIGTCRLPTGFEFDIALRLEFDSKTERTLPELLFTQEKHTLGYVLMEHDPADGAFVMRGMEVKSKVRGQRLSTSFMAVWLAFCSKLHLVLRTKKIDKPILALLLQKFGFLPVSQRVAIEVATPAISPDSEHDEEPAKDIPSPLRFGQIVLWSSNAAQLKSTFAISYLKTQNMIIVDEKPAQSTTVYARTEYRLDSSCEALKACIEKYLPSSCDDAGVPTRTLTWFSPARLHAPLALAQRLSEVDPLLAIRWFAVDKQ